MVIKAILNPYHPIWNGAESEALQAAELLRRLPVEYRPVVDACASGDLLAWEAATGLSAEDHWERERNDRERKEVAQ